MLSLYFRFQKFFVSYHTLDDDMYVESFVAVPFFFVAKFNLTLVDDEVERIP